ncbi:IS3 family transposase [Micromonospora sp. BQ11]
MSTAPGDSPPELHERGHRWNRKAVARLMRLAGIEGAHRRRRGKPP